MVDTFECIEWTKLPGELVDLKQIGSAAWQMQFSFCVLGVVEGDCARPWPPEQLRRRPEA